MKPHRERSEWGLGAKLTTPPQRANKEFEGKSSTAYGRAALKAGAAANTATAGPKAVVNPSRILGGLAKGQAGESQRRK